MQKNFDILRQMKLSFDEHLKIFPFNSCTKLHSKEDIVNRLLISYTMVRLILQIGTDKKRYEFFFFGKYGKTVSSSFFFGA